MEFNKKKYECIEHPEKPYLKPLMTTTPCPTEIQGYLATREIYNEEIKTYEERVKAHKEDKKAKAELFRKDAIENAGLTGHPKADDIFNYIWIEHHSNGQYEVWNELKNIAEALFRD